MAGLEGKPWWGVKGGGGRKRRVRTFSGAVPSLESGKRNQDETAEREETDHGKRGRKGRKG